MGITSENPPLPCFCLLIGFFPSKIEAALAGAVARLLPTLTAINDNIQRRHGRSDVSTRTKPPSTVQSAARIGRYTAKVGSYAENLMVGSREATFPKTQA